MKNFDKKIIQIQILFIVGKVYNRARNCKFESQIGHITFLETDHENLIYSHPPSPSDSRRAGASYR